MSVKDSVMHRVRVGLAAALIVGAASHTAVAHHSTAMFEAEKRVTLSGYDHGLPVDESACLDTKSQWRGADGKPADWSFECGSPNTLSRQGWKPSTLKPGDSVTIVANPMKDGTSAGLMYTVTLADGRVLGPGAQVAAPAQPPTPASAPAR